MNKFHDRLVLIYGFSQSEVFSTTQLSPCITFY